MPIARIPSAQGEVEIFYEDMGPRDGEPLLLIMGLSAQLIWWPDAFCEALQERGFRVIRFDNRDVGYSSRLSHLGRPNINKALLRSSLGLPVRPPYTMADMARDAVGVLDHLKIDRAHICGASLGGLVSQRLTIEHRSRVKSLTLIMTWTGSRFDAIPSPAALRALLRPTPRTRDEAGRRAVELFRILVGHDVPCDEDYFRDLGVRSFDRNREPAGVDRQFAAVLACGSNKRALRRLDVPSLIIHGARDPLVPQSGGRALAKALQNSRLLVFDKMGHAMPYELWPSITGAMADLAGLCPPRQSSVRDVAG